MRRRCPVLALALAGAAAASPVTAQDTVPPEPADWTVLSPADLASAGADEAWTDPWPVPDPGAPPPPEPIQPMPGPGLRQSLDITPIGPASRPVAPQNRVVAPIGGPVLPDFDRELSDRNAYDPVGLRIGSWRMDAAATAGLGTSSVDGGFWSLGGELRLGSEWERHGVDFSLRGGVQSFLDDAPDDPEFDARLDGRFDLTEVDRVGVGVGWSLSQEDDSDPEVIAGAPESDVHILSASIGYERRAGLVGIDLRGAIDRSLYTGDSDRNDTVLSATLRLSLDSGAVLEPFVEASLFTDRPDEDVDGAGYRRAGNGAELKGGLAVDGDLLDGEVALGWLTQSFEDDRLETIDALVVEADLAFAVTPLATLRLAADTLVDSTSIAGASGSVTHEVDVGLSYALRPNIIVDAGAGFSHESYVGADISVRTTTVTAGAAWTLNPSVVLSLRTDHELTEESEADDYRETTVSAAVTLRR
jgi:hypothetical protein